MPPSSIRQISLINGGRCKYDSAPGSTPVSRSANFTYKRLLPDSWKINKREPLSLKGNLVISIRSFINSIYGNVHTLLFPLKQSELHCSIPHIDRQSNQVKRAIDITKNIHAGKIRSFKYIPCFKTSGINKSDRNHSNWHDVRLRQDRGLCFGVGFDSCCFLHKYLDFLAKNCLQNFGILFQIFAQ
jgi:hypothetical protein